MFSMRNFVKQGLLQSVGKRPTYWIINHAAGWHDKGVLTVADLEEIQNALADAGLIVGDATDTKEGAT